MNDLNPSGKCMGPTMQGCPDGADALPEERIGMAIWIRYHCAKCFEIYRRRYADAPPWTGDPLP